MKKFLIEWANGCEYVQARTLKEACGKLKTRPSKIMTGFLVRVKQCDIPNTPKSRKENKGWRYWDAEMFWKYLKGSEAKP